MGEITLPSSWKLFGITLSEEKLDEHEHFTIRALKTFTLDEWDQAIRLRNPKSALIFVHGYNTSFEDALYRNAQIVWDLRYEGLSVLYSWASWGGPLIIFMTARARRSGARVSSRCCETSRRSTASRA